MRVIYALVTVCLVLVSIPMFYDNTDSALWLEETEAHTFFVTSSNRRKLLQDNHQMMKQQIEAEEIERVLKLQSLFAESKNICLNGKDPKKWSYEQIVNEFIKGPCAPVILVPGLAGTSLEIEIDCEKLQKESPEVFESCGWQTCNSWYFWYSKPDVEYRLWISTTTSTVGVIQTSAKDHCFGNLMELKYDSATQSHKETPGLKVTYYGNTPSTQKYSECGLGGIKEMTDDYLIKYMMCDYKGFLNIGDLLKNMGYVSGLLFQAIPYDYRKGIQQSEAKQLIRQSISNLNKITGKKAIILTHSLGSLHTLNVLGEMTKQEKQDSIATIMTMGAPYLGSSKAIRAHLGGDPSFLDTFLGMTVGINYFNQNKAINSASSQVDIYPKLTFFQYQNEPWMQEILKRIQQEKEFIENKTNNVTALSWFPNPKELCTNLTDFQSACLIHMQDLKEYFIEIEDQKFTAQDIQELLDNYTINGTLISQYYQNYQSNALNTLQNPEVPFIVLYGGFAQTEYQFKYQRNPYHEVLEKLDFYFPNHTSYAIGDQTVLTSSALTPAIKWIYEHQNGLSENPIKVIQYCSNYKGSLQQNLFDSVIDGEKQITQSGYIGLECECLKKGAAISDCKHSCLINDKFVVDLVSQLVRNNQKASVDKTPLSKQQLEDFVKKCSNLQI
ncbi:unnamed protein product (macronuclear) [Paramecium tetraurelia]|uniref:Lecithin:cholesterol acyltransferase family protein n=1 Tax=Paramecium tetraurelia TaxID=5888 RepID=A0CIC4_PARTE|nr:uncharacterized protein GSPATT00007676001 [Paramecium tetraurelia]CAK70541.1 unnamed protein product [Paramecium tetraurelia]|eukprot:XP_001437938.1 hypothetical protein (macronuclear) [Paramecium tetraurelia strain d4-2]